MHRDHRLYFGVSLPMVWDVVRNKLDSLDVACVKLLADSAFE
jgi:uncharacterized protein with HEPN domain